MSDVEQTRKAVQHTAEGKLALEKFKAEQATHSTPRKPSRPASKLHTKDTDDKSATDLVRECKEMLTANDAARAEGWDDLLESDYEEFNSAWKEATTSREAESKQ